MKFIDILLVVTATMAALMAGLFFSYSISVSLGLSKIGDHEYIKAMQSINREIQNPLFFACFLGLLIVFPFTTIWSFNTNKTVFFLLLVAALIYIIGVFGITIAANVPLNEQLDKFSLSENSMESIRSFRNNFETKWNSWNHVRTVASILSFIMVAVACVMGKYNKVV